MRKVTVSHSKAEQFQLHVEEISLGREFLMRLGEFISSMNAKLWIPGVSNVAVHVAQKLVNFGWNGEKTLLKLPITREQAQALSYHEDDWDWVDEEA